MGEYRVRKVIVSRGDKYFDYFDDITQKANNLANATRFRQRQIATAVKKSPSALTEHEKAILNEVERANAVLKPDKQFHPSEKNHIPSSVFLDSMMCITDNPDRKAKGLPSQTAQHIIHQCVDDMDSFWSAMDSWKQNPSKFTGRPKFPGYKHKGGHCTCVLTNQQGGLEIKNGRWLLKLPIIRGRLDIGLPEEGLRVKETKVVPDNGRYVICVTLESSEDVPVIPEESKPERIASCDLGVDNIMAVTNNAGLPCVIYKGGVAKSVNQQYNKTIASIMSEQTKGTTNKFHATDEFFKVTSKRNDRIDDFLHKTAKHFIHWCVENRIDTVVIGVNKGWKTEVDLGHVNNQNFVQIPFAKLRSIVKYLCERHGIRYVEQEESYTSKASFPGRDFIPVYGKEPEHFEFSGRRRPTSYKGNKKPTGFRGLYKLDDGTIINADLNGSANILRKAFPHAFDGKDVDFTNFVVVKHSDYEKGKANRAKQNASHTLSKSKMKRDAKKLRKAAVLSN